MKLPIIKEAHNKVPDSMERIWCEKMANKQGKNFMRLEFKGGILQRPRMNILSKVSLAIILEHFSFGGKPLRKTKLSKGL